MSKYDDDDRVWRKSNGTYVVEAAGEASVPGSQDGYVRELPSGRFEAWIATDRPEYREFDTFDDAVYSLIGHPVND